ncbi:hypothetical protein QOT17_024353 [Balamuthia mandrillaris]
MFRLIRKDKDKGKEKEDEGIGESSGNSGSPRAKRSSTHMKNAREKVKERGADSESSDVEKVHCLFLVCLFFTLVCSLFSSSAMLFFGLTASRQLKGFLSHGKAKGQKARPNPLHPS